MPRSGPKSTRSFHAGLRASGKSSTSTIRPTRMSTAANCSNVISPSALTGARSRALRAEPERADRRLERAARRADRVDARDGVRTRGEHRDVDALVRRRVAARHEQRAAPVGRAAVDLRLEQDLVAGLAVVVDPPVA